MVRPCQDQCAQPTVSMRFLCGGCFWLELSLSFALPFTNFAQLMTHKTCRPIDEGKPATKQGVRFSRGGSLYLLVLFGCIPLNPLFLSYTSQYNLFFTMRIEGRGNACQRGGIPGKLFIGFVHA